MKNFELWLQNASPTPPPALQSKIWSVMEKHYRPRTFNIFLSWRNWLAGSAAAFALGIIITTQFVTQQRTLASLNHLDTDLNSLEQEITNDPVIAEILQVSSSQ